MRIVAGTAGGRNLVTPEGDDVRPTKDRVREAIFNSLHSHGHVEGCRFLDLFAGSGALGLEALSRGAADCTFIDHDRRSIAVVTENVDQLGFGDRAVVRQADGMAVAGTMTPHDVALLDPPYSFDAWPELLAAVPAEVVVIESDRSIDPGAGWEILKEKRYAGSFVVIARRSAEGPASSDGKEGIR
jgi:16S rRNA (guanine966-N2)-methyltransferase